MSRQGKTKSIILELIADGVNNLSAISKRLNLAPSTVSKHLHDLEASGAIIYDENPHFRKWKNYVVNNNYNTQIQNRTSIPMKNVIISVIIGIAVLSSLIYIYSGNNSNQVYVPISITDPPQVPIGTQSLYINYTSFYVNVITGGTSRWVHVNSSGTLNLMGIINTSAVIGGVILSKNSYINKVKFNISAAHITINNISYNVKILDDEILASISNYTPINNSSGILLDFYPTVVPTYQNNSTSFLLIPSIYATRYMYNQSTGSRGLKGSMINGAPIYPHIQFNDELKNVSVDANMLILNNSTAFNIYIKNNNKKNITIMCIRIKNADNRSIYKPKTNINISDMEANNSEDYKFHQSNSTIMINGSLLYKMIRNHNITISINNTIKKIIISNINNNSVSPQYLNREILIEHTWYFDMVISKNGSAIPPQSLIYNNGSFPNMGYVLKTNTTGVFTYNIGNNINLSKTGKYDLIIITNKGIVESNISVV